MLLSVYGRTNPYIWKSMLPDDPYIPHGVYCLQEQMELPGLNFSLTYPIVAWTASQSIRNYETTTYEELDLRTKSILRSYPLPFKNLKHDCIRHFMLDDEFCFYAGGRGRTVGIFRRETGKQIWTLQDHIRKHGPPICFRSAFWYTEDRHSFLLKEQVQVPAPEWVRNLPSWRLIFETRAEYYEWNGIAVEPETQSLLILGETLLLIIPKYKKLLRGETIPPLYMHLFLREKDSRVPDENGQDDLPRTRHRTIERLGRESGIATSSGRAAVVLETLTLFDFLTPTKGRSLEGKEVHVPFAVYEWSNPPIEYSPREGPIDHFANCNSVAMDATSIYCVTRQIPEREVVPPGQFSPEYQAQARNRGSNMVTAYHFDETVEDPTRLNRDKIIRPLPQPPPEALESSESEFSGYETLTDPSDWTLDTEEEM